MRSRVPDLLGLPLLLGVSGCLIATVASAADYQADPSNYETQLGQLQPGDTLHLASGAYPLLVVSGLNGTDAAWITITGPESGDAAVIEADSGPCCNTVEISDSSYVALTRLTIDGQSIDGAFGLSAKGGTGNTVHHIRVEECTFLHHDTSQQNVAISTKTPTWGWVIRRNRIVGAGTGLYLGNSDGSSPFVAGLIEQNLIEDTIGYNMQIKWQASRPSVAGMPTGPSTTVIRHNVFIKTDRPSPDGDRPNLLVGGFPDTGAGAEDRYEIYGNFFYHNPRESLLQASGRVSIHDNVFVDVVGNALLLQDHDLPLKQAYVYSNTIFSAGTGIRFGSAASQDDAVVGNLVFADTPVTGSISDERDNLTDDATNAATYVAAPSTALGAMDFYPLAGQCQGAAMDLGLFDGDTEYDRDFNGDPKGGFTYRGAYAGEGDNPGWQLDASIKDADSPAPPTGGAGGTSAGGNGGPTAGGGGEATGGHSSEPLGGTVDEEEGGCGCRLRHAAGAAPVRTAPGLALLLGTLLWRRRSHR